MNTNQSRAFSTLLPVSTRAFSMSSRDHGPMSCNCATAAGFAGLRPPPPPEDEEEEELPAGRGAGADDAEGGEAADAPG